MGDNRTNAITLFVLGLFSFGVGIMLMRRVKPKPRERYDATNREHAPVSKEVIMSECEHSEEPVSPTAVFCQNCGIKRL